MKIHINLTPHDALILSAFHKEFLAELPNVKETVSLRIAVNNFFEEMVNNMPDEAIDDAHAEIEVNILLGRSPERPERKK